LRCSSRPLPPLITTPASAPRHLPAPQRLEPRYALGFTYTGTQLRDYVYRRATQHFARGDAARDALQSPEAVRERQERIRRFFIESLGGLPPSDTPPQSARHRHRAGQWLHGRKDHFRIARITT
jgi:hypothetical protein